MMGDKSRVQLPFTTNLFPFGRYTTHSGKVSEWKAECDALTWNEWSTLAWLASEMVGPFRKVVAPSGTAFKFADALKAYQYREGPLLICDDVLTTGATMWQLLQTYNHDAEQGFKGVVVFARGPLPYWVDALFTVDRRLWDK